MLQVDQEKSTMYSLQFKPTISMIPMSKTKSVIKVFKEIKKEERGTTGHVGGKYVALASGSVALSCSASSLMLWLRRLWESHSWARTTGYRCESSTWFFPSPSSFRVKSCKTCLMKKKRFTWARAIERVALPHLLSRWGESSSSWSQSLTWLPICLSSSN